MKKFFIFLLLAACIVLPARVHASAAAEAAQTAVLTAIAESTAGHWFLDIAYQAKQALNEVEQLYDLYEQLQHWIRNEERYLKNLRSIVDVRSFSDFMDWFNRKAYIARESERIYGDMGVKIGGKRYSLSDIDKIPDALYSEYTDRHWGDISEEKRYALWKSLGLAPSNYFYMKTWQSRNEDIKKRIIAARDMHLDELEDAASRNSEVLSSYSSPSDDIDSNMIAKNSHATQMQIEMLLRELILSTDDLKDYMVNRDELSKIPPNTPMPSSDWDFSLFRPLTDGNSADSWFGL